MDGEEDVWTSTNSAALKGHCDVLQVLVQAEAVVNEGTTDDGSTAAFAAAFYGHADVLQVPVQANAEAGKQT